MEYKHDEENIWEACGLNKSEVKHCSRRLEDIIDDLEEGDRKTSRIVQEIEKVSLVDRMFFRYLIIKLTASLKAKNTEAMIIGMPGSSSMLEALLDMGSIPLMEKLRETLDECDCDDCKEMRQEIDKKLDKDKDYNKH